ncbi:beta-1,3-glucan-binding protein-like [Daphnia pulex]|uniref:beta-1,3-glucan-binding protein-like n=1 Tax=Daphnia pulex TaxID=6669 RepID=UPI001EDD33BB|nr:beta-1,3-glucan-binding protein-like [Daphnia pulex]
MELTILALFSLLVVCRAAVNIDNQERGPIIWQDEFEFLDYSKWMHLITAWRGGNQEFQYYHNLTENSYVRDGILYIKPTLTADRFDEDFLYNGELDLNQEGCNVDWEGGCYVAAGEEIINPIQSARMVTSDSFSFTYGTIEVRAKMPKGDWIWPAIWMKPTDNVYGNWPRSGEIDIVEMKGNANFSCDGNPIGRQLAGSTLHWGPDPSQDRWRLSHWEKLIEEPDFSSDFHVYRVDWLPNGFHFYMDKELIGELFPPPGGFWELGGFEGENLWISGTNLAPFDQRFHFLLNVAVGGNFFPDGCQNEDYDKPWNASDPTQMTKFWESRDKWLPTWNAGTEDNSMQVDYIRVYSL